LTLQRFVVRATARSWLILFGCWSSHTNHEEGDYSKYLGPDWRETTKQFKGKNVSTMVSNHIGFLEICTWSGFLPKVPGFVAGHHIKNFPIGHFYTKVIQSEYVDRTADKEGLERQTLHFANRMKMVEESDLDWGPLCFFAEATPTNGPNLNRFRRGAFQELHPMNIAWFKNYYNTVSPDYTVLRGLDYCFLLCCELWFWRCESHHYPVFVPNEYLFTEYARTVEGHEKMEKWEIYAHAVRDFIKTQGNFGDNFQPNREKISL